MQFDFDSALMGYSAGQKFTSAGDAVVPSLTPRVSGYAQYPYNMQSTGSGFDKAAYDLSLKPLYEIPGDGGASLVPGSGSGGFPSLPYDSVPQSQPSGQNRRILTTSQHSELEMARRRAEKAAEGKRANAEAAKQRFKRKKGERAEAARLDNDDRQGNEEIEQKLSVVEDQKEAKRLKRLLRNRVSAQQARERKKSYVSTIEEKVNDQDTQLAQLRQRVQTLERENGMLRQVIKNIKGSNKDAMLVPAARLHPDAVRVPVLGEN
ncbi:hypothetical protein ABBQ32_005158 [Trebouxia sp. C0010 RCD-2024]